MGTEWVPIFIGIPFAAVLAILGSRALRGNRNDNDQLLSAKRFARASLAAQGTFSLLILIEEVLWTGELSWLGFQRSATIFIGFGFLLLIVLAMFFPLLVLLRRVGSASVVGVTVSAAAIGIGVAVVADGTMIGGASNGGLLGLAFAIGAQLPWIRNFKGQNA